MSKEALFSFIRRSKNRRHILRLLLKQNYTVVDLVKETNMYKSHVSRALSELEDKNLVKCLNPEDRAFKYFKITDIGKKMLELLN